MEPIIFYIAILAGAVGLFLAIKPGRATVRGLGGLVGLGVVAWLLGTLAAMIEGEPLDRPGLTMIILGLIAIAAGGRMITHHRPVYSAIYFILVVLSSAGMFLLLQAEFMAFALVIIYAGAILVTYLFVIMLAQQAGEGEDINEQPAYDRLPREPASAVVVGFILIALLGHQVVTVQHSLPRAAPERVALERQWDALQLMPREIKRVINKRLAQESEPRVDVAEDFELGWPGSDDIIVLQPDGQTGLVRFTTADGEQRSIELTADELPDNTQTVGLALVAKFPVSLELAGVILLMAMFGAVVMARRQIELGEDELRAAAGLSPLTSDATETTASDERDREGGSA